MRVDDDDAAEETGKGGRTELKVRAWETYRGNDWDNKGEEARTVALPDGEGNAFELKVWGPKVYFTERSKCERKSCPAGDRPALSALCANCR